MTGARQAATVLVAPATLVTAGVPVVLAVDAGTGDPAAAIAVAVTIGAFAGVGMLIRLARPRHSVGRLLLGGALVWAVGEAALALAVQGLVTDPGSVPAAAWLAMAGTLLRGAGWLMLVLGVPLVFPDGRLPPAPWRWAAPVAGAALLSYALASLLPASPLDERLAGIPNALRPPPVPTALVDGLAVLTLGLAVVSLVGAVGGLVARWRVGTHLLRQQLLWFTAASALPVLVLLGVWTDLVDAALFAAAVLPLPVAIGVAVCQHRLYDVQFAVNRTLAWAALSVALALVYVLVVAGVGALLDARAAGWLPWLATGFVALSVAPLRDALQGAANRLTYGRWAQPEAVLAGVRRRVADAADVDGLLQDLVRELGEGLGLARIVVLGADGSTLARFGSGPDAEHATGLTAYGRQVGLLRWSGPARPMRDRDRRLLDDIADHLGSVVHSATLTTGLRNANERLVAARDDERRRLRRDLHDGLGSSLAGLTFTVEAARNLLRTDPGSADAAMRRLRDGIQGSVREVRRVVEGLHPIELDELGLVAALAELVGRLRPDLPGGVVVDVSSELPPLPTAVEVAAYRVVQEALTNVVKHAGAAACRVSVRHAVGVLTIDVSDDGSGLVTPRAGGAGLTGMAERAAEVGGELVVDAVPGRGTSVLLRLPTAEASADEAPLAEAVFR